MNRKMKREPMNYMAETDRLGKIWIWTACVVILMVPTAAAGLWKTVYTALAPLVCVGLGIYVFIRRRALR